MTEHELKQYKSLVRQVKRLKEKIEDERAKDITEVMGKVKGSSSSFPFTERRFSVPMYESTEYEKSVRRIKKLKADLKEKEKKINDIESFIADINEEDTKELFTYYFIERMTQKEIAAIVDMDQSGISRAIKKYLQSA